MRPFFLYQNVSMANDFISKLQLYNVSNKHLSLFKKLIQ